MITDDGYEGFAPDVPLLHVYAQSSPHDPAFLVGNRVGLETLLAAVKAALDPEHVTDASVFSSDGEGYGAFIVRLPESQFDRLPPHYTDETYRGDSDGCIRLYEFVGPWMNRKSP